MPAALGLYSFAAPFLSGIPTSYSIREVRFALTTRYGFVILPPINPMEQQMNLKPGESRELSRSNGLRVIVERSGDGKTLRYVRISAQGFEVFKTVRL